MTALWARNRQNEKLFIEVVAVAQNGASFASLAECLCIPAPKPNVHFNQHVPITDGGKIWKQYLGNLG